VSLSRGEAPAAELGNARKLSNKSINHRLEIVSAILRTGWRDAEMPAPDLSKINLPENSGSSRGAWEKEELLKALGQLEPRSGQAWLFVIGLTTSTRLGETVAAIKKWYNRNGFIEVPAPYTKMKKQGGELRAQLAQATEQLKASQVRISQLEGQLKQAPSTADLDKAGKQGGELPAQLAQATEQLKASQVRISQLEGQLKQAPSAADLDDARKEIGELQSQLRAANVIVEGRKSQIEAAKSTPPGTRATAAVVRATDETSADASILLNRGDSLSAAAEC
jgi:hypothetical protein